MAAFFHGHDESKTEGKQPSGHASFKKMTVVKMVSIADEMNPKFRAGMEDTHVASDALGGSRTSAFFAVFDGHGGREVAEYLKMHLGENLAREVASKKHKSMDDAFNAAFLVTDIKCQTALRDCAAGSTAVACLVRMVGQKRYVFTANCGDARAVLCRNGAAERLSLDHKASDPEEVARIEKAGGFVLRKRVLGVLAVARSFGDFALKKFVPCTPYTSTKRLDSTCTFIIIACDGVWDVMTDEEAVALVREYVGSGGGAGSKSARAAKHLVDTALERGTTDNVTALVVFL